MEVSVANFFFIIFLLETEGFHRGKQATHHRKVVMAEIAAGVDYWKLLLQQSKVYMCYGR